MKFIMTVGTSGIWLGFFSDKALFRSIKTKINFNVNKSFVMHKEVETYR